jgi:hypothetical protein
VLLRKQQTASLTAISRYINTSSFCQVASYYFLTFSASPNLESFLNRNTLFDNSNEVIVNYGIDHTEYSHRFTIKKSNESEEVVILATFDITGGPAIIANSYGKERIVLTSPHPKWEKDSSRDHVSYFDYLNDYGSDWPLMKSATDWIFENINY